jgi:hypothetical protein
MLCIMHCSEPYGHLAIDGAHLQEPALSRLLGVPPRQLASLLRDLEEVGVFSRTEEGVIYSRRMVKDEAIRTMRGEFGKLSEKNPNASRAGDKRAGGRPPNQADMGLGKGFQNNPIENPPSSSSSSSLPSLRSGSPPWAHGLEDRISEIAAKELRELSTDDRVVLGRFHAYHFANCTQSEAHNRTRGASISSSLATMAASEQFGDFAVSEYVLKAREYHDLIGNKPWFRPWDIKAVCSADVLDRRVRR